MVTGNQHLGPQKLKLVTDNQHQGHRNWSLITSIKGHRNLTNKLDKDKRKMKEESKETKEKIKNKSH